jgi:GNAT superfamily N-acetyltransferase
VQASAQAAIEGDRVGLYDVFTAPASRGLGSSRWLCERLWLHVQQHGARIG